MIDIEQDASDLNLLASFLARRGVASPEQARADVAVVLGNSILNSVETACQSKALTLVCSGGIGHSTEDLRQSVRTHPIYSDMDVEGRSEAEIMGKVAALIGFPEDRILLESRSTNTGENVLFTRQVLEESDIQPKAILIVQDPTMQLRAHATFQKVWADRPDVRLVSFAPFVPRVVTEGDDLRLDNQDVHGLWPFARFVSLVLGEIARLRDYGPHGKGFIAHVEAPEAVREAHERVERRYRDLWSVTRRLA